MKTEGRFTAKKEFGIVVLNLSVRFQISCKSDIYITVPNSVKVTVIREH